MIIGKGLIASQFIEVDSDDILFFASGVSNSSEADPKQFLREQNLIEETLKKFPKLLFVYFSTCSIYDSSKYNSPYVLHKLHMEEIIKEKASHYLILRVSNAVGKGGNPNLLMNYLYRQFSNQEPLTIHQFATRNLIDVEDVKNIALSYIKQNKKNQIVNVAYTANFCIPEIIKGFEKVFEAKADVQLVPKGEHYSIDVSELAYRFDFDNKTDYLENLIRKYYT
ncbi:NAD-dependent epimerase/dehydratase family protein [Vaginella massiliensis]|uniref:NAD-dependent epimerase/dehydratase family protein n=1 Tax=Vaginella massiliensis TaxID=1816680 RepID=UPI000838D19D|nr:NAD-dependent epimerase/dehydratase family protein [Vaginella massiliensis]